MRIRILFVMLLVTVVGSANSPTLAEPQAQARQHDNRAFREPAGLIPVECAQKPTLEEVKTGPLYYDDRLRTASEALSVGINVVNATGSHNLMVLVRDYKRAVPCTATDGKTQILYGQVIRSVIEIADFEATLGTTLPVLAASATLKRKNQQFYIYKDGFYHPEIDEVIGSVSGKAFDVENYGLYQSVMSRMIQLLSKDETKLSVNKLEIIPPSDDPRFADAGLIAYAFTEAERGTPCQKAKARFTKAEEAAVVEQAYRFAAGVCDGSAPRDEARKMARGLLKGVRVAK